VTSHDGGERQPARLSAPFAVLVRGVDAGGQGFTIETVLDTLSARSFSVRIAPRLEPGAKLFALIRCATTAEPDVSVPRVAVRGEVVRVEAQPDGRWGLDVRFTRYRFL
jgi:hypothetical protein